MYVASLKEMEGEQNKYLNNRVEKFSKSEENVSPEIPDAHCIPNTRTIKKTIPVHVMIKLLTDKERFLKAAKKGAHYVKGNRIKD